MRTKRDIFTFIFACGAIAILILFNYLLSTISMHPIYDIVGNTPDARDCAFAPNSKSTAKETNNIDSTHIKRDLIKIEVAPGHFEDWYRDTTLHPIPNHWTFRSDACENIGHFKVILSDTPNLNGHLSYYNARHGYYVQLPKGMGINQCGEHELMPHGNEFYNNDTTLVVSAFALYYDVFPQYADSLLAEERSRLNRKSKHPTVRKIAPYTLLSKGRIDHSIKENPPADRFIRKWLLRKDIEGRKCEMWITIYFNDSLKYRLPEFEKIVRRFPNCPISK